MPEGTAAVPEGGSREKGAHDVRRIRSPGAGATFNPGAGATFNVSIIFENVPKKVKH